MYPNDQTNLEPQQPPEESSNRTFLIVGGVLGAVVLLSIACLAGIYFFSVMPNRNATSAQALAQTTQNAQVREALTATSKAASLATPTEAPTDTPVLAETTSTSIPQTTDTVSPLTATVGAAFTQAAVAQLTIVPTSTALPKTGIGDQFGAPGLVIMGMVLIAVIFLARRLRSAPTK
jgi:subtilisin family serine protease